MHTTPPVAAPSYLAGHETLYAQDPKAAALEWFCQADFGLFLHYGLYSLLGRGEWVMLREAIPVAEYEQLKGRFTASRFDADCITDLALQAEMRYVNITTRHHDGFCLFETAQNDYHSMASPAKRDLVGELAAQCARKGLGLFLYYSYAADWHHPYFYPREAGWNAARPDYPEPEPTYRFSTDADFGHYIDFVHAQLAELLTNYGPVAGVWFDPISGYYYRPDLFPVHDTYALIRSLQPQTLISFKQGATGDEDFAAPERKGESLQDRFTDPRAREVARNAWEHNRDKHNEICDTMQPGWWGYNADDAGQHRGPDEVLAALGAARQANCNLLMNTGPLPEGDIDPTDAATLREVGQRLREGLGDAEVLPPSTETRPTEA